MSLPQPSDYRDTPELMQPETGLSPCFDVVPVGGHREVIFGGRHLGDERPVATGQHQPAGGLVNGTYNRPHERSAMVRVDFP